MNFEQRQKLPKRGQGQFEIIHQGIRYCVSVDDLSRANPEGTPNIKYLPVALKKVHGESIAKLYKQYRKKAFKKHKSQVKVLDQHARGVIQDDIGFKKQSNGI